MADQTVSLSEGSVAVVPHKVEKKSGKRIGFNYIILRSLKESPKNDVVKCIYIKGITNFGLCVIKEGSQGDTKDVHGRDIRDRLKWQRELHERLAGKVRMPKFLGSFEENGNYYLVIEYIKGKSLHAIVKKDRQLRQSLLEGGASGLRLLGYLEKVVEIVAELHKQNVVHRDVTLNNFMVMPSGKVAVIDMELSYSLSDQFPAPPFALGTHGYMSPEQEAISIPTLKEDIFSLGAIMLAAWSGISPFKFVKIPFENLQRSINFFVEDQKIALLIGWCMQRDAYRRPETGMILQHLREYVEGTRNREKSQAVKKELYTSADISETIERGIVGLADPLLCDRAKGWFADHLSERAESANDIRKTWYASFNRGVSGILYCISRAKATGYDVSSVAEAIQQGLDLIRMKYLNNKENKPKPGLYFGSDGIAMSLAETYKNGLLDADAAMMAEWAYFLSGNAQGLCLADGLAGQGLAHLGCAPFVEGTRERYFSEELIVQQLPEGNWPLAANRRMIYIEYGQAGVIYFLLQYAAVYRNSIVLEYALRGINYLINVAEKKNGTVTWRKKHQSSNNRWCEGNPGMALIFLKAFEITGEPIYREWVELTLNGHDESKLWSSLSLCHGICGLGETYLEAAKVLQDDKWYSKAGHCVQILMHMRQQAKRGGAFWFMERERQPVGNLFVGTSGAVHMLIRYLNVGRFDFPGLF